MGTGTFSCSLTPSVRNGGLACDDASSPNIIRQRMLTN
nr:MAG TPA: hypothetical protein [Caudoviricetes sp.]DAM51346.1 MAG TPA: hypothetical protein [Caudoviricetes sp.]DAU46742.1 MAG TPA: hypothetical protein [Caudoviricetes sp.]DAX62718.1 MAG TPA: hypothetical protein [Caudoviricetes sp.]